jgi:hypothetical protein
LTEEAPREHPAKPIVPYIDDSTGYFIGYQLVGRYNPGAVFPPFQVNYDGVASVIDYGSQTSDTGPVGTVRGVTSTLTVFEAGTTNQELSEHAAYGAYMTYLNKPLANRSGGRAWVFDAVVQGPVVQPSALGGFHCLMNNYYAGLPLDNPSGAYWAITLPGFTSTPAALNYVVGVGFGVVGYSSSPTALGFMIGLQVGGRGSNWGATRSHVSTGLAVMDCDAFGILITRKYSGLTYMKVHTAGSGYTTNPTVTFPAAVGGYPARGFGLLTGTSVASFNMDDPGSGYTVAPKVIIDPPIPSGTQAVATAHADSSGHISIDFSGSGDTQGSGYTSVPNVTLVGGDGTGAKATAILTPTSIGGIAVLDPGFGYVTAPPTTTFSSGSASADGQILGSGVQAVVIDSGGSGYTATYPPTVNFTGGGGGSGAEGHALVDPTGAVAAVLITKPGSGYTTPPSVSFIPHSAVGASATAIVQDGKVVAVQVTDGGGYYPSPPTVTFGTPGSGAQAYAELYAGRVANIVVTDGGSGYSSSPPPSLTFGDVSPVAGSGALGRATLGGVALAVDKNAGAVVMGGIDPLAAELTVLANDAATGTVTTTVTIGHNKSDSPANGFGAAVRFVLQSTGQENRNAGLITVAWVDATDSSRKAKLALAASDSAGDREGIRVEADGSQALLAFFGGGTAVARPSGNVLAGLAALNLISSPSLSAGDIPNLDASRVTSGTFSAARIAEVIATTDLTDVSAKTGSGTTIVFGTGPTLDAANFTTSYNLAAHAAPGSPADGDHWYDNTQNADGVYLKGATKFRPAVLFTQTADATFSNSSSETSVLGTGVGSKTVKANTLVAGKTIRVRAWGYVSWKQAGGTITVKLKLGSTAVCSTAAFTPTALANLSNKYWKVDAEITCRSTGDSTHGSVQCQTAFESQLVSTGGSQRFDPMQNTGGAVLVDTTVDNAVDLTVTFATADANNGATGTNCSIEEVN